MRKRVGLLGLLLVLALGSGAVAQEPSPLLSSSPSLDPTPLFAPDDVASTLPSQVGAYEVKAWMGSLDTSSSRDAYRDLLLPYGKTPDDVRVAKVDGYPAGDADALDRDGPAFTVWALRVDGLPADSYVESAVDSVFDSMSDELEAIYQAEWRSIDGREVYALTPTPAWWEELGEVGELNADVGIYYYPKGEVMFMVLVPVSHASGTPPLLDILAGLP